MNDRIWDVSDASAEVEGLLPDGSADPQYAAALGLVQASIGRRVTASVIDFLGLALVQIPSLFLAWPLLRKLFGDSITWYGFTQHPDHTRTVVVMSVTLGLSLVYCLANVLLNGSRGITVGKAMTGLRTVNVRTLAKPGPGKAMLRALVTWAPVVTVIGPLLVLASPLWDSSDRNRGWADLAAGTWLVDVRAGLNPYDEKRMRIARKTVVAEPLDPRAPLLSLRSEEGTGTYRPGGRVSAGVLGSSAPTDLRGTPSAPRARTPLIPESYRPPAVATAPPVPRAARPAPSAPGPGAPGAAPRRVAAAPLVLVLDTGDRIEVSQALLLGRGPVPTEATAGATPVAIADTTYSVSKTHVLLRRSGEGLDVTDLASTNGTFVVRHGVEHALAAGQVARAEVGDIIRFGDRTIAVHRSGEEPS